jgi:hypothetical protein
MVTEDRLMEKWAAYTVARVRWTVPQSFRLKNAITAAPYARREQSWPMSALQTTAQNSCAVSVPRKATGVPPVFFRAAHLAALSARVDRCGGDEELTTCRVGRVGAGGSG